MKLSGKQQKVLNVPVTILVIAVMLLIITVPFILTTFNLQFYANQYEKNNVYDEIGKNNALLATFNIFSFFKCKTDCTSLQIPYEYHNQTFAFTENEISHMYDVKTTLMVWLWIFYFAVLLFLFFTFFFFFMHKRKKLLKEFFLLYAKILLRAGLYMLIFLIILLVLFLNFNFAFNLFHKLFFVSNWQFPADSLLITLFPESFFVAYVKNALTLMCVFTGIALVLGIIGNIFLKKR
ncbi:DUF1461 domain-containing protein [Candidatus Woesearchaeota archaeon]|nr:MAG: DUF1461 domain-containing protein [Candidatus Woesearchaeota archaeon]